MKGIILAAGKGTRMYPASHPISKTLLQIYDKPAIYYPLSTLISVGIKEILIITQRSERAEFKKLLGKGEQFGITLRYATQKSRKGIADALIIAERFIKDDNVILALGDNVFYGAEMADLIAECIGYDGATVFCTGVSNPKDFGIAEFDGNGNVVQIEEKPENPKSNMAMTGLYYYNREASSFAKMIQPSKRGELEITDVNRLYLEQKSLRAVRMPDTVYWADAGTPDSMLTCQEKVQSLQRTGELVGSPEVAALKMGLITPKQLLQWIAEKGNMASEYYNRLYHIAKQQRTCP